MHKSSIYQAALVVFMVIFWGTIATLPRVTAQDDPVLFYRDLAWSPDGKHLAFTQGNSVATDIGVYDFATAALTMLTTNIPDSQFVPIWSPDSQQLAFLSAPGKVGIMNWDGSAVRFLAEELFADFRPLAFSPDGTSMYAIGFQQGATGRTERSLWAIDVANEHHQKFDVPANWQPIELALSPDSRQLAFVTTGASIYGRDAWVMELDDGHLNEARHFFSFNAHFPYLVWSPDSTAILFGDRETDSIYLVNPATGLATTLEPGSLGDPVNPTWSPDSNRIAFEMIGTGNNVTVWSIERDGSNLTELSAAVPGGLHTDIAWSPDGTTLAFVSHTSTANGVPSNDIWLIQADGSNPINLTEIAPAD